MDKQLFTEKLKPVGYLKRKWGGSSEEGNWEELVFKLLPREPTCPNCTEVEFVKKSKFWIRKCTICGEKRVVKAVVNK